MGNLAARIYKWVTKLQELEYNITTKHLTKAGLENLLIHRVNEKMKKTSKDPKKKIKTTRMEDVFSFHFDDTYKGDFGQLTIEPIITNR